MIVSVLRKEARQNLKGKWKKALLITLLFFLITILLNVIAQYFSIKTSYDGIVSILNIMLSVTLSYGLTVSFVHLKRDEKVNCFQFIYYAVRDAKRVWKVIGRVIFKVLPHIILLILFIYLMITEFISLYYGYGMRLSYIVEIFGVIVFSVLLTMKVLNYSLNNYILYDNKDYKTKEILKESERLMKNHRWDFFKMNLSFAGWILLGILFSVIIIACLFISGNNDIILLSSIAYIPFIFLIPYMQVTSVFFYDNLIYNNPKPKEDYINNKKKKTGKKK